VLAFTDTRNFLCPKGTASWRQRKDEHSVCRMLFLQVYDTDLFRFRIGDRNYLFDGLVPRVYNPIQLLDLNAVAIKLDSIIKQVRGRGFYREIRQSG